MAWCYGVPGSDVGWACAFCFIFILLRGKKVLWEGGTEYFLGLTELCLVRYNLQDFDTETTIAERLACCPWLPSSTWMHVVAQDRRGTRPICRNGLEFPRQETM